MRSRSVLRSLFPLLLAVTVIPSAVRPARAEITAAPEPAAPEPAAETGFVFRPTVAPVAPLLAPLEEELRPSFRLAPARSMTPILSHDEKIVIIVAACIVGAILLVATIQIGSHNHPF